ncbi:MAG: hypothetical protein D6773_11150 [Alphaproteobacteria bacterium]|nr:MAG: hypothetical protein D6773_11150 [Alphaproteobacteria bacterium]
MFGILGSALIGGISSILGGNAQTRAAKLAAAAQERASKRALRFQKQVYRQNRKDLRPWREVGADAIQQLSADMKAGKFDPGQFSFGADQFQESPGYRFRRDETLKALDRTAAARGNLLSGAQIKAGERYAGDLASQEYDNAFRRALATYQTNEAAKANRFNRLAALSQGGQQASTTLAGLGARMADAAQSNLLGTAARVGQYNLAAGQARANMYGNLATAANQGIENWLLMREIG